MNNQNWYKYELQIINTHYEKYGHDTRHWSNIPEQWLIDVGWLTARRRFRLMKKKFLSDTQNFWTFREYGLDGIAKIDNVYHPIQVKLRDSNRLSANELGSFYTVRDKMRYCCPDSKAYLYSTTNMEQNYLDIWSDVDIDFHPVIHTIIKFNNHTNIEPTKSIELYSHQIQALTALETDWHGVNALIMPPGSGKTEVFTRYANRFDKVIIISPTRILTNQNYVKTINNLPENHTYKTLLVDSDKEGTTDEKIIRDIWTNNKVIISSTFDSFEDVISNIKEIDLKDILVIVDEAHNLVQYKKLWDILQSNCDKCLLVTATPPTVFDDDEWDINILYQYTFQQAIQDGIICDYEIYFPYTLDDNSDSLFELKSLGDKLILAKILFMITGMLNKGTRRCILYANTQEEAETFKKLIPLVIKQEHGQSCWTNTIISSTSVKDREKILYDFQHDNSFNFYVLCSVRILDEGIDIVKCDCIFITQLGKNPNDIRLVQRLCRANRKDYIGKRAIAFIWTDNIEDAYSPFRRLKEEDTLFYNKISIQGSYDSSTSRSYTKQIKEITVDMVKNFKMKCLTYDEIFEERINTLRDWRLVETNKLVKLVRSTIIDGWKAGIWANTQRQNKKKGKLSEDKIKKLETIRGWVWEQDLDEIFEEHFNTLRDWRLVETNELVQLTIINGWKAGNWGNKQRQAKKKGKLSEDKIKKLETIRGWVWEQDLDEEWNDNFKTLRDWRLVETNKLVKLVRSTIIDGWKAGIWANNQRRAKKKGKLSKDRIKKLETIRGWCWYK